MGCTVICTGAGVGVGTGAGAGAGAALPLPSPTLSMSMRLKSSTLSGSSPILEVESHELGNDTLGQRQFHEGFRNGGFGLAPH